MRVPGTAARLGGCRAFGGCSDCEGTWAAAARLSSSLPCPASVDISVASFQWQHFGGNILCRRLVVPPCRRRVVVLVASSSSSPRRRRLRRRRRRRIVASSSPRHRRRVVVASCRRCVVSSVPASILTPALTTSAGRRAVVCSPLSHGYPPPPALTTSAGRRVVSSVPASILTAILTGILTAILAPDPHHLTPRSLAPLPETREGGRLQRL